MATLEELKAELKRREAKTKAAPAETLDLPTLKAELKKREEAEGPGILERTGRGIVEALPIAGATIGGILALPSAPFTAGLGPIAGAGAGAVAGEGLRQQAQSMFFPEAAPKTREEAFKRQAIEGLTGATGEMGGQLIAKPLVGITKKLTPAIKEGAEEITAAAERVGVKPSKGMISRSKLVQNIENTLEQSDTLVGGAARNARDQIEDTMSRRLQRMVGFAKGESKFKTGEAVKKLVKDRAGKKLLEVRQLYKGLEDRFSDQPVSMDLIKQIRHKVLKSDIVRLQPRSAAAKRVLQFAKDARNIRTVEDLKRFRTIVGNTYDSSMSKIEREAIDDVYDALTDLRSQSLIFDAESQAQVKQADKLWREFLDEFKFIDQSLGGRPSKSPTQFLSKLEAFEGTDLPKKLFPVAKVGQLQKLAKSEPQIFNALREQKVAEIAEKVTEDIGMGKRINVRKFLRQIDKLEPESQVLLFGENGVQLSKDLKTLVEAFPQVVNASGTARAIRLSKQGLISNSWKFIEDFNNLIIKAGIPKGVSDVKRRQIIGAIQSLSRATGQAAASERIEPAEATLRDVGRGARAIERRLRGE